MPCNGDASKCACTCLACERRGNCCACVAHHRKRDEVPGCLFSKEGEAWWDRSFKAFSQDRLRRS